MHASVSKVLYEKDAFLFTANSCFDKRPADGMGYRFSKKYSG
jgi:hypothetical protein